MIFSLIICIISCIGLICFILFKPTIIIKGHSIAIYYFPALLGSIVLIVFKILPINEIYNGITSEGQMNPLKILSLFISLTFLSVFLDEIGFFKKLASLMIKKAYGNQKKLFFSLYFLISILTIFTSNDIIILTFTPFICCFCKNEKISPVPYLVSEFVAANTWSMALMIGNPTNIYLSTSSEINFISYLKVMWLPTILAGVSSLIILWLLFKKQLLKPCSPTQEIIKTPQKGLLIIGIVELSLCIIMLSVSEWINIPMWLISVISALSLIIISFIYAKIKKIENYRQIIFSSIKRAPWEMIPFVISMFIIVLSLEKYGITEYIHNILSGKFDFIKYGFSSLLISNIINNIPMSILFGNVLTNTSSMKCFFSTIIGSNIGAYLTPIGALAGIMWTSLLKKYDIKFSFKNFISYGFILSISSLTFALIGLYIVM